MVEDDLIRFDSIRFELIRIDSNWFELIRIDSIRFDSIRRPRPSRNGIIPVSLLLTSPNRVVVVGTVGQAHKENSDVPLCFLSFCDLCRVAAVEELSYYRIYRSSDVDSVSSYHTHWNRINRTDVLWNRCHIRIVIIIIVIIMVMRNSSIIISYNHHYSSYRYHPPSCAQPAGRQGRDRIETISTPQPGRLGANSYLTAPSLKWPQASHLISKFRTLDTKEAIF